MRKKNPASAYGWPDAHATIQAAVDAATDGDLILVKDTGSPYASFTVDGKGLTVIGDTGNRPVLLGSAFIRNLGPDQRVVLRRLIQHHASVP